MRRSTHERLHDMAGAIGDIRSLLSGRSYDDLSRDRVARAAFERFLEVLSEASRHVPEDLKRRRAEIPWRRVADLGNWLRHAYDGVDPQLLWQIYEKDLDPLEAAIRELLSRTRPT